MHQYNEGMILSIIKEVSLSTTQQILYDIKTMFRTYKQDLSIGMIIDYLEKKCSINNTNYEKVWEEELKGEKDERNRV